MRGRQKLIGALGLVLLDQISKYLFGDPSILNTGGIFGLGAGMGWEVLIVPLLAWLAYIWMREVDMLNALGLTLLMAGGVANLVDRIVWGGVIDFIHYPIVELTGNIADIYLAFALLIMFYRLYRGNHYAPTQRL